MICIYCNQPVVKIPTLVELFLFKSIPSHEMCIRCQYKFQLLAGKTVCIGCCREHEGTFCEDCRRWQKQYPHYSFKHTALFKYDKEMKNWFEAYKFSGNYRLRHSFSKEIAHFFSKKKDFLIIPLPLSEQRQKVRGFNQVEGLLEGAGITYRDFLIREKDGKPQAQKGRIERLSGEQPFKLVDGSSSQLGNKKVLLVDDIYTTGRTLFHAAEIISSACVKKIETFSLAR